MQPKSKVLIATLALVGFMSAQAAEKSTLFMLDRSDSVSAIHFNSTGLSVGPTRLNEKTGEFRTILTPQNGIEGVAEFSFWSRESFENKCFFKSEFSPAGLVNVTMKHEGNAKCWVSQLSSNSYVFHAVFENRN